MAFFFPIDLYRNILKVKNSEIQRHVTTVHLQSRFFQLIPLNIETFKSKLRIFITIVYYAGSLMERKTLNP